MLVFLTGATGFIGSRVIPELLGGGHRVLGLTRSEAGARTLAKAGVEAHRGALEDRRSLTDGAARADAVIHCGFTHDFTDVASFAASCEQDRRAIAALGEALKGSSRPLLVTSGVGLGSPESGGPAVEQVFNRAHPNPRIASEEAGAALLDGGVNLSVMRLPQVHDTVKQGLITPLIAMARQQGVVPYLEEGRNRWSAGHVLDAARLYRLAIEAGEAGARFHAVGEEGVTLRAIAEAIARGLGVSAASLSREEAAARFGWLGTFLGLDMAASSAWTRERLGWNPTGPGLIADLDAMRYGEAG